MHFASFADVDAEALGSTLRFAVAGDGPPLLLLHGFPQTHMMWRGVAPRLAGRFKVHCADLPGQGQSGFAGNGEPEPYSKRHMARALVAAMATLGHVRFAAAGHDRGGRVAFRMALDHPDAVRSLAVCDVIPMLDALERADDRTLLSFWPWSLMSQPEPLPERLVRSCPEAVIDDSATQWGSPPDAFPADIRAAYADALRDPQRVHAVCEEFRAAARFDREHDRADRETGRTIDVPMLVLWDEDGALSRWYCDEGGPLEIWRKWAPRVEGEAVAGGHFSPRASPNRQRRACSTSSRRTNRRLAPAPLRKAAFQRIALFQEPSVPRCSGLHLRVFERLAKFHAPM